MGVPRVYRNSDEPAIASYNYIDVAEGTGVIVFKGFNTASVSGGALAYGLSSNNVYSNTIAPSMAVAQSNTYAKIYDVDFDVVFNMPKRIKGNAKVSVTLGAKDAVNNDVRMFAVIRLRKWDGTTETEIASAETSILSKDNMSGAYSETKCVTIPITTLQNFNKNDTLRVTLEIFAQEGSTSGGIRAGFACDPMDRDDDNTLPVIETADTTIMEAHIPFILDL